ncbi:MAG TPA: DUF3014 domain-containing protein, partial [Xanthomonadaceae bacterium]|nr:DUF3014 domain-containing protein [Xanthomonadaceae bacterium]
MQSRQSRWPWVLVAVAVAAAGWWLFRSSPPDPAGSRAVIAPAPPAAAPG